MMKRAVVVGLGTTGRAVALALRSRDVEVTALDDRVTPEMKAWAALSDISVQSPRADQLTTLLRGADALLPTPGLPEHHPVFAAAESVGIEVFSELDLAHLWDNRPTVAITGTDGKTTVVTLVQQMLEASGTNALAVGNTDTPFVAALDDADTDVFVVEASSFRLGHSQLFSPDVATWLNFGPDHLDAHASLEAYESAKASIWARLEAGAVAIANRDDPIVMAHAARVEGAEVQTFGSSSDGDHGIVDGALVLSGEAIITVTELRRRLPHDLMNGLAAGASALKAGASRDAIAEVLREFGGLPHRVQCVAEIDGVRFIDDSKATTPHAAAAALQAFESVVLLAGGRNKGLDLGELTRHAHRIVHVVALGEAAGIVQEAFDGLAPSTPAASMEQAVDLAVTIARPGDVVLLSPACASYDWYGSYGERGDDFVRLVKAHLEGGSQ